MSLRGGTAYLPSTSPLAGLVVHNSETSIPSPGNVDNVLPLGRTLLSLPFLQEFEEGLPAFPVHLVVD